MRPPGFARLGDHAVVRTARRPRRHRGGRAPRAGAMVAAAEPQVAWIHSLGALVARLGSIFMSAKHHLVAGAVGRGVSIFAMHPLDTIKTRVQSDSGSVVAAVRKGALYGGVLTTLLGQIPYGMMVFGAFEAYKQLIEESLPRLGARMRIVLAASLADATGSLYLTPFEVLKQQIQNGSQESVVGAVSSIVQSAGPLGLYQGYSGQITRDIPFRALMLLSYEEIRNTYVRVVKNGGRAPSEQDINSLSKIDSALIGALSGAFSAACTNPLDVIKTRLMTQPSGDNRLYTNFIDCGLKTFQREGPSAAFRGVGPRVMQAAPGVAIFFVFYEATLKVLRQRELQAKNL